MHLKILSTTLFGLSLLLSIQPGFSADSSSENEKDTENQNEPKRLVLVAGGPSHDTGMHEHRAGVLLFERCLTNVENLEVDAHFGGWPSDDGAFDQADAVVMYMDGGGRHSAVQGDRLELMQSYIDKGMGFGALHYGVEVPADNGGEQFSEWIGGHYETNYSANPIWEANYDNLPNHPTFRGVEPFSASDEWYFSIRFRKDMTGIAPLLIATPSDETRDGPYVHPQGPYDHIVDAKGESEVMSWAVDRKDGGRGFGFTGGHYHKNWGNDDYRKYVLNSMVWLTGLDVPANGVTCEVSEADLEENLDH